MVTHSKHKTRTKAPDRSDASESFPSPEKVRMMAAVIRKSWTPDERRRRARLARSGVWRQLLAGRW